MIGIGSGTVIGLLSASLVLMGTPGAAGLANLMFVVYFESLQAALGVATIRAISVCKVPPQFGLLPCGFRRFGTLRGVVKSTNCLACFE